MRAFLKKSSFWIAVICIHFVCMLPLVFAQETSDNTITIDILTVNDFHGALSEAGKNPGLARLATLLKNEIAKNPSGTILVSAGDMFQGSPDSNMLYGKPVIEAMNELGFAAMATGNHEFDWGGKVLKDRIAEAKFPMVAANIVDRTTGQAVSFAKPYIIIEKKGLKVAVIGLATPETVYKTSPKYIKNYLFTDPVKTVNSLVPVLKQQGVDIVIVLSHLGSTYDSATGKIIGEAADLALGTYGINAIVSGHTHQKVAGMVNTVPIVQAAYNGRAIGRITLTYSKSDKQIIANRAAVLDVTTAGLAEDRVIKSIADRVQAEVAPIKGIVIGHVTNELSHDRATHSLLGQWVTDTMRRTTKADMAFLNGGSLRTRIPVGVITMGRLYEVMPFDNTLVTLELTGEQILRVLEHGIYNKQVGMVQFSGLKVIYDKAVPTGDRIKKVTLADGGKLYLTKTYKVVTNDFMAQGGDGFTMFGQGKHIVDTNIPLRNCLLDAMKGTVTVNFVGDHRFEEVPREKEWQKDAA